MALAGFFLFLSSAAAYGSNIMKNQVEHFRALHCYKSLKKFLLFHKKMFVSFNTRLEEECFGNQILTDKSDSQDSPVVCELFLLVILPGIRQWLLLIMGRFFHSQKNITVCIFTVILR